MPLDSLSETATDLQTPVELSDVPVESGKAKCDSSAVLSLALQTFRRGVEIVSDLENEIVGNRELRSDDGDAYDVSGVLKPHLLLPHTRSRKLQILQKCKATQKQRTNVQLQRRQPRRRREHRRKRKFRCNQMTRDHQRNKRRQ